MIQHANDPNASRAGSRPSGRAEAAAKPAPTRPARPWPFLSQAHRPAAPAGGEPATNGPSRS